MSDRSDAPNGNVVRWTGASLAAMIQEEAVAARNAAGAGSPVEHLADAPIDTLANAPIAAAPVAVAAIGAMPNAPREWTIEELSAPDYAVFAEHAYVALLGRLPTSAEREAVRAALRQGDTKTWLLGRLRFGQEGRRRAVVVPGLRLRYLAQRLFRVPVVGRLAEWTSAVARLPRSLRYLRGVEQNLAERAGSADARVHAMRADLERIRQVATQGEARAAAMAGGIELVRDAASQLDERASTMQAALERGSAAMRSDVERLDAVAGRLGADAAKLDARASNLESSLGAIAARATMLDERTSVLAAGIAQLQTSVEGMRESLSRAHSAAESARAELAAGMARADSSIARIHAELDAHRTRTDALAGELAAAQAATERVAGTQRDHAERLDRFAGPSLDDALEVPGQALLPLARARTGLAAGVPVAALTSDQRYALFESVFYESDAVAAKQRIYLRYLDPALTARLPFLDLGCGRGEFMQILREHGVASVGVDINSAAVARLADAGFQAIHQDLVEFLRTDRREYSGAASLQVVEHLDAARVEEMLALVYPRLAPGAVLLLETPNPLSPFALGRFHTDPTHVAPLPSERLRFAVELAGFVDTRTLYQARIPGDQWAGPDPTAHYVDYAIIAYKRP